MERSMTMAKARTLSSKATHLRLALVRFQLRRLLLLPPYLQGPAPVPTDARRGGPLFRAALPCLGPTPQAGGSSLAEPGWSNASDRRRTGPREEEDTCSSMGSPVLVGQMLIKWCGASALCMADLRQRRMGSWGGRSQMRMPLTDETTRSHTPRLASAHASQAHLIKPPRNRHGWCGAEECGFGRM